MTMRSSIRIHGFTLVELLMALAIAGMIAAFAISISSSISSLSKQAMTKARMETIAAKARQYYRSHKVQVDAAGSPAVWVPVTSTGLNLEQKYRLDGWGKFLYYRVFDSSDLTNISGFDLKSSSVKFGAVITSAGPDQLFGPKSGQKDKILSEQDFKDCYEDSGKYLVAVDNDLILWVSFNQEATEIALEELQVLQEKVEAFDAMFEGIDNDNDNPREIDEDGCLPYDTGLIPLNGCLVGVTDELAVSDPNCGRKTLDEIEKNNYTCDPYDCNGDGVIDGEDVVNACCFLIKMYDLSGQYYTDPWGARYQWSDPTEPLKHHKFWSYGPDGSSGTVADDIVF